MPAGEAMDSQYSVRIENRFMCGTGDDGGSDEDPFELIIQAQSKPKKDKDKKAKKDAKPKKEDKPKIDNTPENENQGEGELASKITDVVFPWWDASHVM